MFHYKMCACITIKPHQHTKQKNDDLSCMIIWSHQPRRCPGKIHSPECCNRVFLATWVPGHPAAAAVGVQQQTYTFAHPLLAPPFQQECRAHDGDTRQPLSLPTSTPHTDNALSAEGANDAPPLMTHCLQKSASLGLRATDNRATSVQAKQFPSIHCAAHSPQPLWEHMSAETTQRHTPTPTHTHLHGGYVCCPYR